MPAPTVVEFDIYDNYDKSLMDWLSFFTYSDKVVPKVFATPDRAFQLIAKAFGIRDLSMANLWKAVPRPFVSVDSSDFNQDPKRYQAAMEKKARVLDSNGAVIADPVTNTDFKTYQGYAWPQSLNIVYNIEYWASTGAQLKQAISQWAKQFRCNETFMTCHHPEIFGDRSIPIVWDDVTPNSVLEPGDPERTTLRMTFMCTVKGWIPRATQQIKVVRKIVEQVYFSADLVTEDTLVYEQEITKDEDGIG